MNNVSNPNIIEARRPTKPTTSPPNSFQAISLVDFTSSTPLYLGQFQGNLYENGSNDVPLDYDIYGQSVTNSITPLDSGGNPSTNGKIVLISIGMSNTAMEWCGDGQSCTSVASDNNSFMAKAAADSAVNHTTLKILNGAMGGMSAETWVCATGSCEIQTNQYDKVKDNVLTPAGMTEAQVQVIWAKVADKKDLTYSLPDSRADAYRLEANQGSMLRAMKTRYPNLKIVVFSSRIYGGYAGTATQGVTSSKPMEPYAYESNFATKWVIQAKIDQWRNGMVDPQVGDLSSIPFVVWDTDTYLWGNSNANPMGSQALSWVSTDYNDDKIHPNSMGINKVASRLLTYFKTSPYTSSWFLSH